MTGLSRELIKSVRLYRIVDMSDEEQRELPAILEEIDDPELVRIAETSDEAKQLILSGLVFGNDVQSLKTLRHLMSSNEVSDRTRLEAVQTWLSNRRENKKIDQAGQAVANGFSLTFNFGTNEEADNAKRARAAFGIDNAEDAERA